MSMLLESSGLFEPLAKRLGRRHAGVRHLRRHDPAGRRGARRPARPAQLRRHRHRRAPQRLRPPGRQLRGRPRRRRARRPAVPRRVHPRAGGRAGRPGRRGAGRARRPCRCWPARARSSSPRSIRSCPATAPASHASLPRRRSTSMSGHSKWATIKHKKGAADKARGKLFAKLIRQVEVAAREGGGDLERQPHAAHDVPEGPGRVGAPRHHRAGHQAGHRRARGRHLRVDHLRGLRARRRGRARSTCSPTTATAPAPRSAASSPSMGGSMAEPGAVAWQFEPQGRRSSCPRRVDEDDVMLAALDAGAEDIVDDGDELAGHVRAAGRPAGGAGRRSRPPGIDRATRPSRRWCPRPRSRSTDAEEAKKVLRIIDALEDNDDVQDVYANFDIPDDILDSGGGLSVAVGVGDAAPDFTLPGTGGRDYSLSDYRGPAGRARLLPGRRHAGVHQAAEQPTPTTSTQFERARRPGAGHQPAGRRRATSAFAGKHGVRRSRCWPTPTRRSPGVRHARPARLPPPVACS